MNAVVFADGSAYSTATRPSGPGGVGYVARVDGRLYEGSLELLNATNQQAEILAAAYVLDQLDPCDSVIVYSDSEYVVKGMTAWIHGWQERGWVTTSGKPVKNQPHWRRLLRAADKHAKVQYRWVRGHDGDPMNERADELAVEARRRAEDQALQQGA